MEAITAQIRTLATTATETGRKQLLDALKSLQYEIETPFDTLWRFQGLVGHIITSIIH